MEPSFPQIGGYQIIEELGKGGMSTVYRAIQTATGLEVAIKVTSNPNPSRHFREVAIVQALNHPHIVRYVAHDANCLVMPLLEGQTLADYFERGGTFTHNETFAITRQVCDGLNAAHELDVIHRDVKPENVFLQRLEDGSWYVTLIDFGVALVPDGDDITNPHLDLGKPREEQKRVVMGTPSYMSPEQAMGEAVSTSSDLYSVGLVFLEMLINGNVTTAEDALMHEVRSRGTFPTEIRETVGSDTLTLLQALLALRAEERPTAAEASRALQRLIEGKPPFLEPEESGAIDPIGKETPTHAPKVTLATTPPERPRWIPFLTGTGLGVLFGFVALVLGSRIPRQRVRPVSAPIVITRQQTPPEKITQQPSPVPRATEAPHAVTVPCHTVRGLSYAESLRVGRERLPDHGCWSRIPATRRERICARLKRHGHDHEPLVLEFCATTHLP